MQKLHYKKIIHIHDELKQQRMKKKQLEMNREKKNIINKLF